MRSGAALWPLLAALVAAAAAEPRRCRQGKKLVVKMTYSEIWIDCLGCNMLEFRGLPPMEDALNVTKVTLHRCPLPSNTSLADVLAKMNVGSQENKPFDVLTITNLPPLPSLAAEHFTGFDHLRVLYIATTQHVSPEPGFLEPLRNLLHLTMHNVSVTAAELEALPPSLVTLALFCRSLERLPAFNSLPELNWAAIQTDTPIYVEVFPSKAIALSVRSPATTLQLDALPSVMSLEFDNWTEQLPKPVTLCNKLFALRLLAPAMRALPAGWLLKCLILNDVFIENARFLKTLPAEPFLNSNLPTLTLRQGALEALPPNFADDLSELRWLDLKSNRLETLSRNIFWKVSRANLSWNNLDNSALKVLKSIGNISELDLSHNPRIRDLCSDRGLSPLAAARNLTMLLLSGTGVTRICRDWREAFTRLKVLDLSGTRVTTLAFEDLQFARDVRADVWLRGAPVAALHVTRRDYILATRAPSSSTTVHIDAALPCDCRMYWARRALDSPAFSIRKLRCVGGEPLHEVSAEDMECARPQECAAAALPAACSCAERPDGGPDGDRRLVRVRCENASLTRVPRPRAPHSTETLYEMHLAHNRIAQLHADDLYNITGLDLSYNSLRNVDGETAAILGSIGGTLKLTGNPLECDCDAASLARALRERALAGRGLRGELACRNGSSLDEVSFTDCSPSGSSLIAWVAGSLVALLSLALAATACLASRSRRLFALAVLHRWGCAWRAAEPRGDAARRYDAFLTFSHRDEAVARELVARLEPPYRLCVHHRDWVPGGFIGEQVARSVRESRRTVALVSRHFLASAWARAEFREAHAAAMLDARPRLLVVLLEEPAALPLDDQLQAYVRTNVYVRWDDPRFWDKLRLALPPPRPPPPAARAALTREPAVELSSFI